MTDLDHAWAAGFLDGEGCFAAVRRRRSTGTVYYIEVTAAQVDLAPLQRLRTLYGGSIHVHARGTDRHARSHKWKIVSKQCAQMLPLVAPHLSVKGLQTGVLMALQRRLTRGGRRVSVDELRERDRLVAESRWLNRRGVPRGVGAPTIQHRTPTRVQLRLIGS